MREQTRVCACLFEWLRACMCVCCLLLARLTGKLSQLLIQVRKVRKGLRCVCCMSYTDSAFLPCAQRAHTWCTCTHALTQIRKQPPCVRAAPMCVRTCLHSKTQAVPTFCWGAQSARTSCYIGRSRMLLPAPLSTRTSPIWGAHALAAPKAHTHTHTHLSHMGCPATAAPSVHRPPTPYHVRARVTCTHAQKAAMEMSQAALAKTPSQKTLSSGACACACPCSAVRVCACAWLCSRSCTRCACVHTPALFTRLRQAYACACAVRLCQMYTRVLVLYACARRICMC